MIQCYQRAPPPRFHSSNERFLLMWVQKFTVRLKRSCLCLRSHQAMVPGDLSLWRPKSEDAQVSWANVSVPMSLTCVLLHALILS